MTKEDVVQAWVSKAEHDFINAKNTLNLEKDCPYDTACFHAQQAIEKYMKALLCHFQIEFPKTHDVRELLSLIPADASAKIRQADWDRFSNYAVAARYPAFGDEPSREETQEALLVAEQVKVDVLKLIHEGIERKTEFLRKV